MHHHYQILTNKSHQLINHQQDTQSTQTIIRKMPQPKSFLSLINKQQFQTPKKDNKNIDQDNISTLKKPNKPLKILQTMSIGTMDRLYQKQRFNQQYFLKKVFNNKCIENKIQKKKSCNCRKSNCLKLYCQCFAEGNLCNQQCRCCKCYNKKQGINSEKRAEVLNHYISKDPYIFSKKRKMFSNNQIGCYCSKSQCQKKYCQCFSMNKKCNEFCKCKNCQNMGQNYIRKIIHSSKQDLTFALKNNE